MLESVFDVANSGLFVDEFAELQLSEHLLQLRLSLARFVAGEGKRRDACPLFRKRRDARVRVLQNDKAAS